VQADPVAVHGDTEPVQRGDFVHVRRCRNDVKIDEPGVRRLHDPDRFALAGHDPMRDLAPADARSPVRVTFHEVAFPLRFSGAAGSRGGSDVGAA
jgi:hypothetical protein